MTFRTYSVCRAVARTASRWLVVAAACAVALLCHDRADAAEPASADAATTVRLVVDYNDGVEKHFTSISWKPGMTVFDVLQVAKSHAHGITFRTTGSGATLFVTAIDGLQNQGGGENAKNWIYSVNGKKGNKSCAVNELKAGDVVQWKFDAAKL